MKIRLSANHLKFLFFGFVEHGVIRALDAGLTFALLRMLSTDDLGLFAIFQSWVALFLIAFPALENNLYRNYAELKRKGGLLGEVRVFQLFNLMKIVLALLLAVMGASLSEQSAYTWLERFLTLSFAFSLPLAQALYGIYRETLRFEMHQKLIAIVTFLQKSILLGMVLIGGWMSNGKVGLIAFACLLTSIIFGKIWSLLFFKYVSDEHHLESDSAEWRSSFVRVFQILSSSVFWTHINGSLTAAIQTLDVYFLSKNAVALNDLALYGVSLKIANFMQLFVIPVCQAMGVYLARKESELESPSAANSFIWITFSVLIMISVCVFGLGVFLFDPLIHFLGKGKFSSEQILTAKSYFNWLLGGVCLQVLGYAHGLYINFRAKLKPVTFGLFIPWFMASAAIYYYYAQFGLLATAKANVLVYFIGSAGHILMFIHCFGWPWKPKHIA